MNWMTRIRVGQQAALSHRLADAYAWHQAIWRAFPRRKGGRRAFLTRIDCHGGAYVVFLLSHGRPEPQHWGEWEMKPVAPSFLDHERYVFRLRANPTTKRVVRDDQGARKKNGRRTRIYGETELRRWLDRKAEVAGFRVLDVRSSPPVDQRCRKKGHAIVHASSNFEGLLDVIERPAFIRAWSSGIGPSRAFGFGLLLLKPIYT